MHHRTSKSSKKPKDANLKEKDVIMEESPLDARRGTVKVRLDPPVESEKSATKPLTTDEDNDDKPLPLSNIKLRPKSKDPTAKLPAKKQRKAHRPLVEFEVVPTKVNLVVEPEDAPPAPKIDHPFRTVVTATVRVDKVKDTLTNFIDKLTKTIDFLRTQVDDTIAIVPKTKDMDYEHIIDKPSFPRLVFKLNQRYFNIETRGAFMDATKTQNGRTIKLSLVLGSTVQIDHQLLDEIWYDFQDLQVNF